MINLCSALSWLNVLGPQKTRLRNEIQPFVAQFFDAAQSKDSDQLANLLTNVRYYSKDPLEKAEALLNAAAANCILQRFDEATVLLKEALGLYDKQKMGDIEKRHCQAITNWALGSIARWLRNPTIAFHYWEKAFKSFNDNGSDANLQRIHPNLITWYPNQTEAMEMDLLGNAPYVFTWFNFFGQSRLNQYDTNWHERISKLIGDRDYDQVQKLLKKYSSIADLTVDSEKKEEIYVICGLASYYMTNYDWAMKNYQKGICSLPSRQHNDAVIYWLMGIAQWECSQQDQATANWEKCITYFSEEEASADRRNCTNEKDWYTKKIRILNKTITRAVNEYISPLNWQHPFNKPPATIIPTIAP